MSGINTLSWARLRKAIVETFLIMRISIITKSQHTKWRTLNKVVLLVLFFQI